MELYSYKLKTNLLISIGENDSDPTLNNKQAGGKKYTGRLSGPTFDLTYRGHEEGNPAHHNKHAKGKVQIERTQF
jgi:hypothetical protein